MLSDKATIKGTLITTVLCKDGSVKKWSPKLRIISFKNDIKNFKEFKTFWYFKRMFLKSIILPLNIFIDSIFPRLMISVNHNIVTDYGDALIADLMSQTPAKQKLDNTHAYIEIGTAYSATAAKQQNTGCHTPTGDRKGMESTYPKQKGAFGAANDNTVQYRSIWAIGTLGSVTVNEAALLNASTSGECQNYGHVTPDAVMTAADSLQVDWEVTPLGA